ncbi:TonB-dependent receptor [Mucilaginibacter sp. SMC90]|uniref:TonB-dependent receptor domain-containing protein n=1 Tax=Mucilaginibacter sp. SMC90 TaxID=2929803 RepID=UPI001FB3190A|nr:TonB-dependent receptor [Mucilaginibacter sp. SMC90]UOE52052.1 TonB-dependent receptor [Mucilaginibacter sp. SMC90]
MDFSTFPVPVHNDGRVNKFKNATKGFFRIGPDTKRKFIMRIKLIAVLLFAVCMHLSAKSFSQNITLAEKNSSLQTVLNKIEQQSGYDIFMQTELLTGSNKVSLNVKNETLTKVLDRVFKGQPVTYAIVGHTIVVKEKTTQANANAANAPASLYTGKIVDADTKEPLVGASVGVKGGGKATSTGLNGTFKLNLDNGDGTVLVISYIGYITKEITLSGTNALGNIELKSSASSMKEVVVTGDVAIDRKTPVAVTTINQRFIEEKLGNQDIPQLLSVVPGVMATQGDGGYGDSRVNIRGFSSRSKNGNVAQTINGIPVNDMENGSIFWSDFSGLTDIATSIQVQRGLGANKIIVPSFGGTINITTRSTDMEPGGFISQGIGSDGYQKTSVLLSTGLDKNGWAATFQGSRTKGDGNADGLNFLGYNYFFNVSKRLGADQTLSLTLMGATQNHGQRPDELISDWQNAPQGIRWNYELGVKDGKQINPYNNNFSKPLFSLNHEWNINGTSSLSTVLYATYGTGGGGGIQGDAPRVSNMYSPFDYTAAEKANFANPDGSASTYFYSSHNNHTWYGIRSTYHTEIGKSINLSTGIDLRSYDGTHYETVTDLLGADYVYDAFTGSNSLGSRAGDINNPEHRAVVGDKIDYYNKDKILSGAAFAQAEYSKDNFSVFATLTGSGTANRRTDYYNYLNTDPNQTSKYVNFLNYQAKAGANYNINDAMNVFANVGYMTKPPYFDNIFQKFTNNVNPSSVSEKLLSYELGYGLKLKSFSAKLNAYRTSYNDESFATAVFDQATNQLYTVNVAGVDELHQGLELEMKLKPIKQITINGMLSYGDWHYTNDAGPSTVYNSQQQAVKTVNKVYLKDIKVGDAAQTTAALGADIDVLPDLTIGSNYFFYGNYYSQFNFANAGQPDMHPYKLPNYSIWNLNGVFRFKIAGLNASLIGNVNNLLNTKYIADSYDGNLTGNVNNVLVYYGLGRTFVTSLKIKF